MTRPRAAEDSVISDERAIRELVALWHRATGAGDVDTVLGLMTEDVVFLVAGRPPMRGRDAFERGLRGMLAQNQIESSSDIQEIEVAGSLAYCWSELSVRVIPNAGGSANSRAGPALTILRKQSGGSWAVARDANLLVERS
jgi:uncharacterized protein (TIGR02246 family)